MEKNRYFIRLRFWHLPKNKLQHEITNFIKNQQRKIIDNEQAVVLIKDVKRMVQSLNNNHPRCKPEKINAIRVDNDGSILIDFEFTALELHAELKGWSDDWQKDTEAMEISKRIVELAG